MAIERTIEGLQVRLEPRGFGRFVTAGFLAFWLCGWAAGEAFALWMLVTGAMSLVTGTPPSPGRTPLEPGPALAIGAFLLFWLALWTVGGVAAMAELLRLVAGRDRVLAGSGRLVVTWSRGPFRRQREYAANDVRGLALVGRDDRLAVETATGRVALSALGSPAERAEAAQALRAELGLAEGSATAAARIPPGWEEIVTTEGARALVADRALRRKQAVFAATVTLFLGALTGVIASRAMHRLDLWIPVGILLAFTAGAGAGAAWLALGRWEWRIASQRVTLCRRFGGGMREVFEGRRLLLDHSTDSDGDAVYELVALANAAPPPASAAIVWRTGPARDRRTVARVLNDPASVRDLAAWLARETGLALDDRTTPQARQVELAELRAALEGAGRIGRWAARLVDRAAEDSKRAG